MEKIASLISSDVPQKFVTFKTHLSFIEHGWSKVEGNFNTETYQSSKGHVFSAIIHQNDLKQITNTNLLIDDDASLDEIDHFLDEIVSDSYVSMLSGRYKTIFQSRYFDYVLEGIVQRIGTKHGLDPEKFDHYMFFSPRSKPGEIVVPQGYVLGRLREKHADVIAQQWAKDTGFPYVDTSFIIRNVTERPGFGVFTESDPEKPIAWVCFYREGAIAMMHVKEDHRRKGLARVLLRQCLVAAQETHGMECRINACVKKNNTASQNLLLSEGWELQPYNYKKIFFRNPDSSTQ